ncbi:lysyl-tRNA synthetase [Solirubrobacter pauli]|uniref:Lysine--tRNA ligase n=1 Tax=Solirubrobacter pauli TaxID=166793 RepID=A0A660LEM0_9ACTN|nr:lysine--tRNA ligase [Solirubrobacter pauli]RKQ93019.1 lysyl-tRNA synthetase [Solirubrobacter pauli]
MTALGTPTRYERDHTAADLHGRFAGLEPDACTNVSVRVAGRLMLIRRHGGLVFATLHDQTGDVQVMVSRAMDAFADAEGLDRGDWIGVAGTVITTHTGELTVQADEIRLLAKAHRALPDKHRGLVDPELRLRERHLDLIANPATRHVFDVRSAVVSSVRSTLIERGFTEVETPVLEASAGGATARPFTTHHNALDTDFYLRIALELPLKRLVVGGFERVFEIGRVFRNEGIDTSHNPEFTLLEAYQAFADYEDMMELVETIVARAALAATGSTRVGGIDLAPPWRRVTMAELVAEHAGVAMHPSMPLAEARAICDELGILYETGWGAGKLMAEVFEATAEHTLIEPTFVLDHPREISPLARAHRDDPHLTERFEAFVGGRELANAYSELNDPVDQRARFEAEGFVDESYVRALECGLPPTGGLGIGIDRLVMLIADVPSIRDVILFPALRPERGEVQGEPEPATALEVDAEPPIRRPRLPRVLGAVTGLAGASLVAEHAFGSVDHVPTAVIGVLLVVLATGLWAARRRAWTAAVILTAMIAALRSSDPQVLFPAVALLVTLVWHRRAFDVRRRRRAGATTDADRERARALVLAHGTGTLDYFALRPDKQYFFTRAGDAMLAYRTMAGHALVSGDPVGPPEAHERLLGEFLDHCRRHGRRAAFLGAREADLPLYRRHGLRSVYLGDEAVVRCDAFTLENKSVRTAVNRVGRQCSFRLMREVDAPEPLRDALNALRERWRDGAQERGFTMELGGGVRGEDPELLLAVAFATNGRPLGFLRLVPCCGSEPGWSLDLMQHDPDAPNGMTEYLIAMTATELHGRGDKRLSLNFATWGRLFAQDARLSVPERAQRRLAHVLNPYFQIESLRDFNAKFDPEWVPRSIVVQDPEDLPWVGVLYAAVEGFIALPRRGR